MEKEKRIIQPKTWYMGIALKKGNTRLNVLALYRREFKSYTDVLYFMKINGKSNNLAYMPIKGEDAIEYGFTFIRGRALHARVERLFGYDYPVERLTYQDRKSFRTKSRRWMRNYKIRLNTYNDIKFIMS